MDAGLFFLLWGRSTPALYIEREGRRTLRLYKAKAELTTDSESLRAFGQRSVTLVLYIGRTEASVLYIRVRLTLLLYIGEGGRGISKNIFFMSARDSSISALRRPPFVV